MEQNSIITWDASREINYKEWIFFSNPSKSACTFQSVSTTGYPAQEHDVPVNREQWQPGGKYCTVQDLLGMQVLPAVYSCQDQLPIPTAASPPWQQGTL